MHAFREAVEAKDHGRMVALLAEDVTFRSPVVHKPYEGREALSVLLAAIMQVLEDFRYEREIASGDDAVLRRTASGMRAEPGWRMTPGAVAVARPSRATSSGSSSGRKNRSTCG